MRIQLSNTSLAKAGPLQDRLTELLTANDLPDAAFRYTVTGGPTAGGLPRRAYTAPTELLVPRPLSGTPSRPISLHVLNTRRNSAEFGPRPKSLNYLNSLAGHFELLEREVAAGDEGIMLDRENRLCEGVTSNLFLIRDHRAVTPRDTGSILPGVTRRFILSLSRSRSKLPVTEEDLTLDDLIGADAIFITNSVRGLVPVSAVYGAEQECLWQKNSSVDPLFNELTRVYSRELPQP